LAFPVYIAAATKTILSGATAVGTISLTYRNQLAAAAVVWSRSSVKNLLDRAREEGLVRDEQRA